MTDNKVIVSEDGVESVIVNRSDGMAIAMLKSKNYRQLIMTTEKNKVVKHRSKKLGIKAILGVDDKKEKLRQVCIKKKIDISKVMFVGNDLNDLEAMKIVGYPIAPSDAVQEVIKVAKMVTNSKRRRWSYKRLLNQFDL